MDALARRRLDEIIISTHPETRSGWLRQDLVERVEHATGLPVEHVVVDLDADRDEATRTLVVANQTVGGEPLIDAAASRCAREGRAPLHRDLPAGRGDEDDAPPSGSRTRCSARATEGLQAIGQVMHPDPFTAIQNALQFYASTRS